MDASIETDSVLLHDDLFLDQGIDLLLQEVALVDVDLLMFLEVFLKIWDVLNNLLQNIVGCLGGVMLQRGALASQQLHLLLIVIQQLHGIFWTSLNAVIW